MTEKLSWTTQRRKVKDLLPTAHNPRKITKLQAKQLTESLEKFNLVELPAINTDGKIIAGHQRVAILKTLGRDQEEIEVRVPNRALTKSESDEYMLRSNKNTGEWDWTLLGGADFGRNLLSVVGFSTDELQRAFDTDVVEDEFDAQKEYDRIGKPTAKAGDIYQLGKNRLMCGDSTKAEDMEKLLDGKKANLIYVDPPYNVNYDYPRLYKGGRKTHSLGKTFEDNRKPEAFLEFLKKVFTNLFAFSHDHAPFYCWHASKTQDLFQQAIESVDWHISQTIFWLKNQCTFNLGLDYLWIMEPCYFGWKSGKKHYVNKQLTLTMKNIEILDKLEFDELLNVIYSKRDAIKDYIHPTQKPIALAERAIKKHSEVCGIVLDAFAGSGSTLMACHQLGRLCYTMELDPKFVDVIIKRFEKYTNIKAKLL